MTKLFYTIILGFLFSHTSIAQPWIAKADLPGPNSGRWSPQSFALDGRIYIGGGYIGNGASTNDFWHYDPATDIWTTKGVMPGAFNRTAGIAFSINGKGYIGLGSQQYNTFGIEFMSDLWEYDPAMHSWTQKASLPDSARHHAAWFVVDNKVYVVGGTYGYPYKASNATWEYDPATNQWTAKAPFPTAYVHSAMGFTIGNYGYIVGGNIGPAVGSNGESVKSTYRYDPSTDTWTQRADYCSYAKEGGVAFVLGDKAYVGMGYTDLSTGTQYDNEFCRYDAATDTWTNYPDLAGSPRAYGTAVAVNGKGYVGGGFLFDGSQVYFKDWFQVNDTTLSVGEPANGDMVVDVFPNPVSDLLYVRTSTQPDRLELKLYDMLGRQVAHSKGGGLSVKHLPLGCYSLMVTSECFVASYKIEVIH